MGALHPDLDIEGKLPENDRRWVKRPVERSILFIHRRGWGSFGPMQPAWFFRPEANWGVLGFCLHRKAGRSFLAGGLGLRDALQAAERFCLRRPEALCKQGCRKRCPFVKQIGVGFAAAQFFIVAAFLQMSLPCGRGNAHREAA